MDTLNITEEIKKLEQARKNTNNKREDVRLKAIILKLQGMKVVDIAKKLDVTRKTIYIWIKKYEESSISGLLNKKELLIEEIWALKKKKRNF